jgi:hypothetical protein
MTRETINYARLSVEACEALTEGPAAFANLSARSCPSLCHCMCFKTTMTVKLPEPVRSLAPLFETKHCLNV